MKQLFIILLGMLAQIAAFSQTKWQQTDATISFTIKNRGSNVEGHFGGIHTTLVFSPDKLASSSLKGTLDVTTIKTGIDKRDQDLQAGTYFDAAKHHMIEMTSTSIVKNGDKYTGTFNISIKGNTNKVVIPFTFTESGGTAEFKSDFTINRRDYSVGNKSGLAMFMSDDVHVTIDIKAKK